MAFVLDASLALAWLLPDETTAAARLLLDRIQSEPACAPAIWPLEIANALLTAERRKRISDVERSALLEHLGALPILIDKPHEATDLALISEVARKHDLSIYDACYLQLAQTQRLALATFDRDLLAAAKRIGVPTLPSPTDIA
ncbi:MAG TPA: type II toxin-antitoxin system VapC family toxin [Casimicrobiaceae bacterium]|nr:type II toxin-antitoxin system VapC family toxin [Casimicrobiaceae bacterium]